MKIPVYPIKLKEYQVKTKPDFVNIGKKLDKVIKKHFSGKKVAIRCLSSKDHNKSVAEIIKIIKEKGTDRYNSKIKGDRYDNIGNKKIDIFALDFKVSSKSVIMENFIEPFYVFPMESGEKPIRINIVIIYDFSKLKRVMHQYEGREDIKKDGFIFKDPNNKKDALLGIIKIL